MKTGPDDLPDLRNRTKEFALRIIRLYTALPKVGTCEVVGKQVVLGPQSAPISVRLIVRGRTPNSWQKSVIACEKLRKGVIGLNCSSGPS